MHGIAGDDRGFGEWGAVVPEGRLLLWSQRAAQSGPIVATAPDELTEHRGRVDVMRSFSVRQSDTRRAFVLMAPGWVRTVLGGPGAPFTIDESVPLVVDVLLSRLGKPGLEYLDRWGRTIPW